MATIIKQAIKTDLTPLRTAREQIRATGLSISKWARKHGFATGTVYEVLSGKNRASCGEGFEVAATLGLKPTSQPKTN